MVLVLSSMYSSNNNLSEASSELLNISGKRYNRNSSKTIWSYNPEDATGKKLNSKWRPNSSLQKQTLTNSLLTGSFTSSQVSEASMQQGKSNLKPKLSKYFDENEGSSFSVQQPRASPRQSTSNSRKTSPSSSASSRSSGKKPLIQASIVSTVVLPPDNINKLIELNTSASRRVREKAQELEDREDKFLQQSFSNKIDKQLLFREVAIVRPESSSPVDKRNENLKKMIDNFNEKQQPIVCGKHIDNLTTEIFVALSNGINKNALLKRSVTSVSQSVKEKNSANSMRPNSVNLNEFYEVEENDTKPDNFVLKICNEIKNYQPEFKDEMSIKNSISTAKSKSVTIVDPKEEVVNKRPTKNILPSDFNEIERLMSGLPIEEKDDYDFGNPVSASYFDPNFNEGGFSYKYKKVLNDQFQEIIEQYDGNSPVELTLKQTLPLNEYYVSLTANSPQISRNEKSNDRQSDNKKSRPKSAKNEMNHDFEMYNILKRMMVKKKYEAATIKMEKAAKNESDKRKRRCQSLVAPNSSTPNLLNLVNNNNITSSNYSNNANANNNSNSNNNMNIKIKTRPTSSLSLTASSHTFNGLATSNSLLSKPFAEDDDDEENENLEKNEDYCIGEPVIRCTKCKKKFIPKTSGRQTPSTLSDRFDLYDEFKISNEAIKKDVWPYELDTSRMVENNKSNKKNKKQSDAKCYSCRNIVPVEIKTSEQTNFEAVQQSKSMNENIFRIQIQRSATSYYGKKEKLSDQQQYQSPTYTSARRVASAKYINLNNIDLTDSVDKDEFHRLKCSHPKQMTSRELIQYQRKTSMIPGKTFSSQRRQSITINRPPLSKIKADYDKENKISQLYPLVKLSNPPITSIHAKINNRNVKTQQKQRSHQRKQKQVDDEEFKQNEEDQQQQDELLQSHQEPQELQTTEEKQEEPQIMKEESLNKFSSDSIIEKYRENKKFAKKFNIDPFVPAAVSLSKLKLYHNDQFDQLNNHKEISAISAFHIYRKASRLINKRPKTAK